MTTRERTPEERPRPPAYRAEGDQPPDSSSREAGDAFLAAADVAIERALSGTSEAFLAQNRQQGGQ